MAKRRKYGRNPVKYNLREILILVDHHLEDVDEGLHDKDYSYAIKSVGDIEKILSQQKPPIEFLERVWPMIAKAKLKILSQMAGMEK